MLGLGKQGRLATSGLNLRRSGDSQTPSDADKYSVKLSETAEKVYVRFYEEAEECLRKGDPTNSKVTRFNIVEDALENIIPHYPFNPQRGLVGPLSNIFRITKGRMRICYIGSSEKREIVILFISETPRKEGDRKDPYQIFKRIVMSGKYNSIFDDLGIKRPNRNVDTQPTMVQ